MIDPAQDNDELDEDGETYIPIGVGGLLAASEKLLAVNRGLAEPDERESLAFKRILRYPKQVAERVRLDTTKARRKLAALASRRRDLSVFRPFMFDDEITGSFIGNPLATPSEEINPMMLVEQSRRISAMGPGGIGSREAVTADMQNIHGSQMGFFSPIEGPECFDRHAEVMTQRGWVLWSKVKRNDKLACLDVSNRLVWELPFKMHKAIYRDVLYCFETPDVSMRVTRTHRVVLADGKELLAFEAYGKDIEIRTGLYDGSITKVSADSWYTQDYDGMVYCASVPGGKVYVRGEKDSPSGYWSGNSELAGLDVRVAVGTKIGSDGQLYRLFRNARTGNKEWLSPSDLVGKTVGLPD